MNPSPAAAPSLERAKNIANAVLYEGYLLYPYRPSAVKNRQRWTFGGVYPQAYSQAQMGHDPWTMQTECLFVGDPQARLEVTARFLHLCLREVGELDAPLPAWPESAEPAFRRVESLRVGDQVYHTWQEAVEREVAFSTLRLDELCIRPQRFDFTFPASRTLERLGNPAGEGVGVVVRQQQAITGVVAVSAEFAGGGLFKINIRMINCTPFEDASRKTRDEALLSTFVSTHTLLSVQRGEFVSLLDPPEAYREVAGTCHNIGTYPVLVGDEGGRDLLLSSPIILYDYPQLAPESAGDLFDGTEIDEILTLRILTLTEAEKEEIRQADERGRELLERTESLPPELLQRLHGAVRGLRPLGAEA